MEASQSGGWPMMHAMMAQQSPGGGRVTPSKMLQATTLSNGSLFVHVYIPWNRVAHDLHDDGFLPILLPVAEGWRHGWIEPSGKVEKTAEHGGLLTCTMHWRSGSKQECYIAQDGTMYLSVVAESPSLHRRPDTDTVDRVKTRELVAVSVSFSLTEDEIESGSRGEVHGLRSTRNGRCKVSHIGGKSREEGCFDCVLVPTKVSHRFVADDKQDEDNGITGPGIENTGQEGEENLTSGIAVISSMRLTTYAPEFLNEYRWRSNETENVFRVGEAQTIAKFLNALHAKCIASDSAVRKNLRMLTIRNRGDAVPERTDYVRLQQQIERLATVLQATAKCAAGEKRNQKA